MKISKFIIIAFILFSAVPYNVHAQAVTRLIGYEETCLDTFGALLNYKAYWNSFSGRRGSVVGPVVQVGCLNYQFFPGVSSADTTRNINRHLGSGGYADSSMSVWVYNNNDNPVESRKYVWNFNTSSWSVQPDMIDSFFYSSNRLLKHNYYQYDSALAGFRNVQSETYTYNTSGKLIAEATVTWNPWQKLYYELRQDYIWSGNNMTGQRFYDSIYAGGTWRLQQDIATTYVNGNPVSQTFEGWNYPNNIPTKYDQRHDSNVYTGNKMTARYSHYAGYNTSKFPFNFRDSYQYDTNGNVSVAVYEAIDTFGVWNNDRKKVYTYNSDNNPVLITNYDWNGSAWVSPWRGNINTHRYYYAAMPTSVATHQKSAFSIYPIPAQNSIHLKTGFKKDTDCIIAIVDMQGMLQRQWTEQVPAGSVENTIPVNNLPDGNYLIRISTPEETLIKQFNIVR